MAEDIKNKEKSEYRGIFKATSLFGGVQAYQIFIDIIKSKFIAILLGPEGVGIQGLYTSATSMIQQLTSFGLSSSAVRNIAEAKGTEDKVTISKTVTALRRLVWLTGILGMITVILLSPLLSKSSFGDSLHIWGFIALSVTLLLSQINAGQRVILQGMRQFKYLAKCTTYGLTIGLIVSIPLYFLWGTKAIVPNLIISAVTSLLLSWYFSKKVPIEPISQTISETFSLGKTMLTMGITMSLTHFLAMASSFVLRSSIRAWGGIDEVGLYTAGFLLMTQYTGLVFQAMGTDFYPRLAAVNQDNQKCKKIMNQQGEIGLLLLGPLMAICVIFIPIVIRILYSEDFLAINDYIIWCALGVIFQMASWSVSYVIIAKAESKLFAINEFVVGIYGLLLNLIGYYWGGLMGLGISFAVKYFIYMIQVYCIARNKYDFSFTETFIKIFIVQLIIVLTSICIALLVSGIGRFVLGSIIIASSAYYSFKELDNRMDILSFIKHKIHKNG